SAATSSGSCQPMTLSVRCQAAMWWFSVSAITPSKSKRTAFQDIGEDRSARSGRRWGRIVRPDHPSRAARHLIAFILRQPYVALLGVYALRPVDPIGAVAPLIRAGPGTRARRRTARNPCPTPSADTPCRILSHHRENAPWHDP